ncbi:MAG: hypothetical protein ACI8QC_001617 [Planctomycetota bacterium]|jgi:hypothetical protein
MSTQSKKQQNRHPILFIGDGRVEWVQHGAKSASTCQSVPAASHSPRELAGLAAKLVQDCGDRPGRCILMLGGDWTTQKVINLVSMGPKDLARVLQRKATGLLGVESADAWYRAIQLCGAEAEEKRWLICALRKSELLSLTHELKRAGFHAVRISSPRFSILTARGQSEVEPKSKEGHTRILLNVEPQGASISLLSEGSLVQQSYIAGSFDQPGFVATLLQELRSFEGFWRKLSRGGSMDEVLVIGLTEDAFKTLCPAINAALGNPECAISANSDCATDSDARANALIVAANQADPRGDLSPKRPPSYSLMTVCAAVAIGIGLDIGFRGQNRIQLERTELEQRSSALWLESRDHDRLTDELGRAQQALAVSDDGVERLLAVGNASVPLADAMQDVEVSFEGFARLDSIQVSPEGKGYKVTMTGSTDSDPGRSLRNLNQVIAALETSATFTDVVLEPRQGALSRSGSEDLSFEITSKVEIQ